MDANKMLEGFLNQLEYVHRNFSKTKEGLLAASISPFEPLFIKDKNNKYISANLKGKEKEEVIKTFDEDLLPMFEENNYQKGIDQINEWKKILEENPSSIPARELSLHIEKIIDGAKLKSTDDNKISPSSIEILKTREEISDAVGKKGAIRIRFVSEENWLDAYIIK